MRKYSYKKAICIYCGKSFLKAERKHRQSIRPNVRGKNCITCSHECSLKYSRLKTKQRLELKQIKDVKKELE